MTLRLETERLIIRPFEHDDFDAANALSDESFGPGDPAQRREWLNWSIANEIALARLGQPPYGDRAIVWRADDTLVGSVGFVPSWGPFNRLPTFAGRLKTPASNFLRPAFGLFWSVRTAWRNTGIATEAARAMIEYAFEVLKVAEVVATTEDDNLASQAVMRKLGMSIEHNPGKTPEWFQVVGVLENPMIKRG